MSVRPRSKRLLRAIVFGLAGLLGLVALTVAGAAVFLQGERLGGLLGKVLPEFRGRLEVKSVRWSPRALLSAVTDEPVPIVIDGLTIWDPEGTVVLRVPHLEVKVPVRSATSLKILLHDLKLGPGSLWRFAAMSTGENGFLSWFQPKGAGPAKPEDKPPAPPPPAGAAEDPFLLRIVSSDIDGLTAQFDFPDAWGLELRNLRGAATLHIEGDFVGWDAPDLDARDGGYLRILQEVLPFDRVLVRRVATTRDWPNDIFLDVASARTGRTDLRAKGFFHGIYGYKGDPTPPGIALHAEMSDAADALAAVAKGRDIPGLRLGGEGTKVRLDLSEAFERLRIDGEIRGLDAAFGAHEARALGLAFKLDLAEPMQVTVDELSFSPPGGGRFSLDAGLRGTAFRTRVRFDRFSTGSYVPPGLRPMAAGKLHGQLRVEGDFGEKKRVALSGLDLALTRARPGKLPRTVRLRGQATATPDRLVTDDIVVAVPGGTLSLRGQYAVTRQLIGLALRLTITELPQLLGPFGVPPVARGAAVSVGVRGRLDNPIVDGDAVVRGVRLADGLPEVPELRARFGLENGTARLDSLTGDLFGGKLLARGTARLWRGGIDQMLATPVIDVRVEGKQLDIGRLFAYGVLSGRIDFVAEARGPVTKLTGRLTLPPGAELELLGERWRIDGIEVDVDPQGVVVNLARLRRDSGAQVDIVGRMAFAGPMAWQLDIRDAYLQGIPGVKDAGVPITGKLTASLSATGSLDRPVLAGHVALSDVNVRGVALGDARIDLSPTADGGVGVTGDLFGRLTLAGAAALTPAGPKVDASLTFKDVVVEELLPELAEVGDARARLSGRVRVELGPGAPLTVEAVLTDLQASVAREGVDEAGRPLMRRLAVRNGADIRAVVVGDRIIVDPTRLITEGGEFRLQAAIQGESLQAEVGGFLNLELAQAFLPPAVKRLAGDVRMQVAVRGSLSHPVAEGSVLIASPVRVQLAAFDPELVIPSGAVRLARDAVKLDDLALTLDGATLTLRGQTELGDGFALREMEVLARGELSARMLSVVAPSAVTESSGRLKVDARVWGTPEAPEVAARLDLAGIELRLRGFGRVIALERGAVELTSRELVLRGVDTRIEGRGVLTIDEGRVAIKSLMPLEIGELRLPLRGDHLAYADGAIEFDDIGFTLVLAGDMNQLGLTGEVRVVTGRYLQDFTIRNLMISPSINESAVRPFWEGQPLLESLRLGLRVRTFGDTFLVQNNIAPEMYMVLDLRVGGTLSAPRISGDVRPTEGRFHIPGIRDDFNLVPNVNYITFVDTKSIANGETPELLLEAESSVTDSAGREHNVRMRIRGPIGQMQMDLTSDQGLDRNQAMMLIVSGRTLEDTSGFRTTNPTVGSNLRTGTDLMGQLTRDSVANLVEPYIDDTLQLLTGRRINLRPTVGPDGFELRMGARMSRQLQLNLSFLRGFLGQRRYRAEGAAWVMDYVTLRGILEQITLAPQQGIVETFGSARLELSLDFPIRLPLFSF